MALRASGSDSDDDDDDDDGCGGGDGMMSCYHYDVIGDRAIFVTAVPCRIDSTSTSVLERTYRANTSLQ